MTEPFYRGYSTVANTGLQTQLQDVELVKQDLRNHFNTRLGERVGRPSFGSIIWDLLFDLSDARTESVVISDAQRIIDEDPRVELLELVPTVDLNEHSIRLDIKLRYIEFNMDDWFTFTFREQI